MQKVLIFGASGTIGKSLSRILVQENYNVYGTFLSHNPNLMEGKSVQLSIQQLDELDNILRQIKPDFAVMALRGDFDEQIKFHHRVAEFLKVHSGHMIFCSTTNVFDASIDTPHYEDEEPDAESDYGKFKIDCEKRMRDVLGGSLTIVRIPQIFGQDSIRIRELHNKVQNQEVIKAYRNLYITSNSDVMLSKQIAYLMDDRKSGVFHLATNDMMFNAEFVKRLLNRLGYSDVKLEEEALPEESYFAILSKYQFPDHLQITNEELLDYLSIKPSIQS